MKFPENLQEEFLWILPDRFLEDLSEGITSGIYERILQNTSERTLVENSGVTLEKRERFPVMIPAKLMVNFN